MADIKYYDVIKKPVITEKSMNAMAEKEIHFLSSSGSKQISDQRSCRENVRRNKSKER